MKIIDTSDENIKYHAMKNIIYRRNINKLFQTLLNKQEMMTNEQFEEIMCLEYEYELYYNYHFMYEWQPMFVDRYLKI